MSNQLPAIPPTQPQTPLTTVSYAPRNLRMHLVTAQELDDFASGAQSIHIGFGGLTLGVGGTLLAVLVAVKLPIYIFAAFIALALAAAILTAYFAARAVADLRSGRRRVQDIKDQPNRLI